MTTMPPVRTVPVMRATTEPGCWANFTSGVGKTVNWCGRQIATAATAVWGGIQKIAQWAAAFFKKVAYHIGVGFAAVVGFVQRHSREFIVGGIALAVGLALGLIFSRICGCCNKPVENKGDAESDNSFELDPSANDTNATIVPAGFVDQRRLAFEQVPANV